MKIAVYGGNRALVSGQELETIANEITSERRCFLSHWGTDPFCEGPAREKDEVCILCKRLTPLRQNYLASAQYIAILGERAKQQRECS